MNYKDLEKESLKEMIKANAEMKGFELSHGWPNLGQENMIKLAEEIDAAKMPEPEDEPSDTDIEEVEDSDANLLALLKALSPDKIMELLKKSKVDDLPLGKAKVKGNTSIKARILAEPKVLIEVPEDILDGSNHITLWVQGVEFIYAREQMYEMPAPVAEAFRTAQKGNYNARKKMSKMTELNM